MRELTLPEALALKAVYPNQASTYGLCSPLGMRLVEADQVIRRAADAAVPREPEEAHDRR
jgi:hypothetical protein